MAGQYMKRTVIITGAAHGLGKALALEFAASGDKVIAVDYDADALNLFDANSVVAVQCDLANLDEFTKLDSALSGSKADVLIHCAGISATGKFEDVPSKAHRDVIAINLTAPIALTTHMLAQRAMSESANITLISSLSHFLGYPGASCYAATKDGLAHYGKSLQKAYPKKRILRVFPGPIDTEHARRYAPDNSDKSLKNRMSADQVAICIVTAIQRRRKVCVPGMSAKLGMIAGRIAPRTMGRVLRRALLDKMDRVRT
jgi:short-subunit dehydrogenase